MSYVFFLRTFKLPVVALLAMISAATIMVPLYRARLRALDRMAAQARIVHLNGNRTWLRSAFPKQAETSERSLGQLPARRTVGPLPTDTSETPMVVRPDDESLEGTEAEHIEHNLSDEEIAAFLRSTNPDEPIVEYPRGTEIVFDSLQHIDGGEWVNHPLNHFGSHTLVVAARTIVRWQQRATVAVPSDSTTTPVVETPASANPSTETQPVALVTPPTAPAPHIRITNPAENRYPVSFLAGQRVETLQPGQVLDLDAAELVVRFDRGREKQPPVRVELTAGEYHFRIDAQGWDLSKAP